MIKEEFGLTGILPVGIFDRLFYLADFWQTTPKT